MRIHEFAKELKMENKDLLAMLEKMGLSYKSVHSTLEESDVERVKNQINLSRKEGLVEKRIKPTVIRRRVMREEPPPPSLVEEADKEVPASALKTTPLPESAVKAAGRPLKKRV
jgi:translation initiation factor IF-2